MKIIKKPQNYRIECDCGCVFEVDNNKDIIQIVVEGVFLKQYTFCPFCGKTHYINFYDYKKENEK